MTCVQVACSQLLSKPRCKNPTSTSQSSTFSPSSLRLNLIVPWVAGWDGPICNSMISDGSSLLSAFIAMPKLHRSNLASQGFFQAQQFIMRTFIDERSFNGALRNSGLNEIDRIVFAQRKPLELVVQKNAPQIGMIDEANAEQIPDLASEEVSAAPKRRERFDGQIVFRHWHANPRAFALIARQHLIDDFEARLFLVPIIHRRDVRKKIVVEPAVFLQSAKTFTQSATIKNQEVVALHLHCLDNLGAKCLADH